MQLYVYIGKKIQELRETYGGKGISQEVLAKAIKVQPNTLSRWENYVYKPKIEDLEKLAKFFGVRISEFLPVDQQDQSPSALRALLSATKDLHEDDIRVLTEFAEFRKAKRFLKNSKNK